MKAVKLAQRMVDALLDALGDEAAASQAAYALGELGPVASPAIPRLIELLSDPAAEFFLRGYAAKSLGQIGGDAGRAVPLLFAALDEPEFPQDWAVFGLRKLAPRHPSLVATLVRAFENPSYWVRSTVLSTLAELHPPEALSVLIRGLSDPDPAVRYAAAEGLGVLGDARPEVIEALTASLLTDDPDVQFVKTSAVRDLGIVEPVREGLRRALAGGSEEARLAAQDALLVLEDDEEGSEGGEEAEGSEGGEGGEGGEESKGEEGEGEPADEEVDEATRRKTERLIKLLKDKKDNVRSQAAIDLTEVAKTIRWMLPQGLPPAP